LRASRGTRGILVVLRPATAAVRVPGAAAVVGFARVRRGSGRCGRGGFGDWGGGRRDRDWDGYDGMPVAGGEAPAR